MDVNAQANENVMGVAQSFCKSSTESLPLSNCVACPIMEKSSSSDSIFNNREKTRWHSDSLEFEIIKNAPIFDDHNSDDSDRKSCIYPNKKGCVKTNKKYISRLPVYGKKIEKEIISSEKCEKVLLDKDNEKISEYDNKQLSENINSKVSKCMKEDHISYDYDQKQIKSMDSLMVKRVKIDNINKCSSLYSDGKKSSRVEDISVDIYSESDKKNQQNKEFSKIPKFSNTKTVKSPSMALGITGSSSRIPKGNVPPSVTIKNTIRLSKTLVKERDVPLRSRIKPPGFVLNRPMALAQKTQKFQKLSPEVSPKNQVPSSISSSTKNNPSGIPRLGDLSKLVSDQQYTQSHGDTTTTKNTSKVLPNEIENEFKEEKCKSFEKEGKDVVENKKGKDIHQSFDDSEHMKDENLPKKQGSSKTEIDFVASCIKPPLDTKEKRIEKKTKDMTTDDMVSKVLPKKKVEFKESQEKSFGSKENKTEENNVEKIPYQSTIDSDHKRDEIPTKKKDSSDQGMYSTASIVQPPIDPKELTSENYGKDDTTEVIHRSKIKVPLEPSKKNNYITESNVIGTNLVREIRPPPVLPKITLDNDNHDKGSENRCDSVIDIEKILENIQDDIKLIGMSRQSSVNDSENERKRSNSRGYKDIKNKSFLNNELIVVSKDSPKVDTEDLMKHLENVLEGEDLPKSADDLVSNKVPDEDEDDSLLVCHSDNTLVCDSFDVSKGEETLMSETEFLCSGETLKGIGDRFESDEYVDSKIFDSGELKKIVREDLFPNENDEAENNSKNPSFNEEDFIDVNFDIKPMSTLKRPLAYGYSNRLPRTLRTSVFVDNRLSSTSKMLEDFCMHRDVKGEFKKKVNESSIGKECMNLKQTYWDIWLAKQGLGKEKLTSERTSTIENTDDYVCPMERFSYDPEILLAQVKYPESLANATFSQYSAYVQSHIYDHFRSMTDISAKSQLEPSDCHSKHEWTISDPELTSEKTVKDNTEVCFSTRRPEYTVSDPELTPEHKNLPQSQANLPFTSESNLLFGYGSLPRRKPGEAEQRDHNKDMKYLFEESKKRESYLEKRISGFHNPGYMSTMELDQMFGVPHSASTRTFVDSADSGSISTNPWEHLLPLITPPQTPYLGSRSNLASHDKYKTPSIEKLHSSCSPSHSAMLPSAHQDSYSKPKPKPIPKPRTQITDKLQIRKEKKPSLLKKFLWPKDTKSDDGNNKTLKESDSASVKSISKPYNFDIKNPHISNLPSVVNKTLQSDSNKSLLHPRTETFSSSISSSSASSADSTNTVVPASSVNSKSPDVPAQKTPGNNWFMKHFGK